MPETPNCETPGVSTISRPLALQAPRSEAVRQHSVALLRQKAYDAERETLEKAVRKTSSEVGELQAKLAEVETARAAESAAAQVCPAAHMPPTRGWPEALAQAC